MTPLKFDGFNRVYKKNELQPDDIPAQREDGKVTSRWLPSNDELMVLQAGGSVELVVHGGQPAIEMKIVP